MTHLLILAQNSSTAEALQAIAGMHPCGAAEKDIPSYVANARDWQDPSDLFREISAWLQRQLEGRCQSVDMCIVLTDEVRPHFLNPIEARGWDTAIAMLILAFPEIRWIFGFSRGGHDKRLEPRWRQVQHWHGLPAFLSGVHPSPLFDGSGLRDWVRNNTRSTDGARPEFIPLRPHWAAAIDDEVTYAFLNAYNCYRFGFRAWAVTSDHLFQTLFGAASPIETPASLTIEDLYLGFPDKEEGRSLSDLRERQRLLPRLDQVQRRCFVTSSHGTRGVPTIDGGDNSDVLRDLRSSGRGGVVLLKPCPGLFTFWNQLRLATDLTSYDGLGQRQLGRAPGFVWPPPHVADGVVQPAGHSAPRRLLQISELLLARAERILESGTGSVPMLVKGAVMSLIAYELLGARTPTTARDALELKHQFEVRAECQFGGIEFNVDLKSRFQEINSEMRMIGHWFNRRQRDVSLLNGEVTLTSRLMKVFREYDQHEEAEVCRSRVRTLNRRIWAKRSGWRALPVLPLRWYIETLLGSTQLIFLAILSWIAFFVAAQIAHEWWISDDSHWRFLLSEVLWRESVSQAVLSFLGSGTSDAVAGSWFTVVLSSVAALTGFLHLGILIAHIYRLLSRT